MDPAVPHGDGGVVGGVEPRATRVGSHQLALSAGQQLCGEEEGEGGGDEREEGMKDEWRGMGRELWCVVGTYLWESFYSA